MTIVERPLDIGDVVRLKSGSPKLTVVGFTMSGVAVAWIAYNGQEPQQAVYPLSCLEVDNANAARRLTGR